MRDETDLQIQFWHEYHSPRSDFSSLVKISDNILEKAKAVQAVYKKFNLLINKNNMSNLSLMFGFYFYYMQNDFLIGQKRLSKFFYHKKKSIDCIHEKLKGLDFDNGALGTLYFILSTNPKDLGKILDCPERVKTPTWS